MGEVPSEGTASPVPGDSAGDSPAGDSTSVLTPNMLLLNGNAVSSTFANVDLSHSVLTRIRAFNTRVHRANFEGSAFDEGDFDGATFTGCSMRGVELVNCDVDRLVVNGVNVGNLLRLLLGEEGRF